MNDADASQASQRQVDLAVVVPAYNEAGAVAATIRSIQGVLDAEPITYTLTIVDDGSSDGTADAAEQAGAEVIRLEENCGYGAALRAGILATDSDFVAILDADGTYPEDMLPELFAAAQSVDMVVGSRAANSAGIPLIRRWPKRFLNWLASYLAGRKIPDLNSGLRVFRRKSLHLFLPILPSGFSFTTTITLAMLCTNHRVKYVPIEYRKRVGDSKIKPFDFVAFIILVLRTIVLFNPLKVFLPLGTVLFVGGVVKFVNDIFFWDLSESAIMGVLAGTIVWSLGLLADMISRLHLRP